MKNFLILLFILLGSVLITLNSHAQYPVNRSGVSIVDGVALRWATGQTYDVDELVLVDDVKLYVSNTLHVSSPAFITDIANWSQVGGGGILVWTTAIDYLIDEVVYDALTNKIYRAIANHTSGLTFAADVANWVELSNDMDIIGLSTDNAIMRWDGVGGDIPQDSSVLIDDTNNVSGIVNLTLTGTTTLDTGLTGFLKAASGVVSAQAVIDLTADVGTTILPIANGGSNSATALTNDKVMYSQGGAIVESSVTLNATGDMVIDGSLTIDGLVSQTGLGDSTYFGELAGVSDDLTANLNTGIGYEALRRTTTGINNVAVGNQALENNTTGSYNTMVGTRVFQNSTGSATNNTGLGNYAGRLITGVENTVMGAEALENSLATSRSIAIGFKAGTRAIGNDNVIIGTNANGHESGGGMNRNVVIGSQTGTLSRASDDNILIGYGLELPTTTTSNYMSLGDLLYGDLTNSRIGINVAAPTVALDVVGGMNLTEDILMSGTGQIDIPTGTTAQRSGSPDTGMIRFNSTLGAYEGYDGSVWGLLGGVELMAKGSLLTSNGTSNLEIAACADGEIIEWDAAEAHGYKCVGNEGIALMAKGSLYSSDGSANLEVAACANGEIIVWDSTIAHGYRCEAKSSGGLPLMAKGAILTSSGTFNGEFDACADTEILEWDSAEASGIKCVTKPVPIADTNAGTICAAGEYLDGDGTCITVSAGYAPTYSMSTVSPTNKPANGSTAELQVASVAYTTQSVAGQTRPVRVGFSHSQMKATRTNCAGGADCGTDCRVTFRSSAGFQSAQNCLFYGKAAGGGQSFITCPVAAHFDYGTSASTAYTYTAHISTPNYGTQACDINSGGQPIKFIISQ